MSKKNQLTTSDYLPMSELKKLLECLHEDKQYLWELYVRISFCTALRISDVLSLTWADILNRSYITKVEKKTGKTRQIPLNARVQRYIGELYLLLKRPNPNELLFKSKRTGAPISSQYINRIMKTWKVQYQIQIGNFSSHTFRKTFGRNIYDTAEDKSEALILLNQILRHTNLETTKRYLGIRADEIKSVFASLDF